MIKVVDEEGLFRHAFQYAGAGRTWRWAGRKIQQHNLPRPPPYLEKSQEQIAYHIEHLDSESFEIVYGSNVKPKRSVMDALASGVRPAVQAPKGKVFVAMDYSSIENLVLGMMAKDEKILRVFRQGLDPYIDFSTYMFGGTYAMRLAEYQAGNKEPRTISKPAVLGCGYQMGAGSEYEDAVTGEITAGGLLGYAWGMGIRQFTQEQAIQAVKIWRETFEASVDFWFAMERAALRCVRKGQPVECDPVIFDRKGPFLRMVLPSGRALHYCRPKLMDWMMPWGEKKLCVTYEEENERKQFKRVNTGPGKLTENGDQAISRDLLGHGIKMARKAGLDIRLHVHDEIVALVWEHEADEKLKLLHECMTTPPLWWPKDIPINAKGSHNRYYVKD
jgi:DNA polymerase